MKFTALVAATVIGVTSASGLVGRRRLEEEQEQEEDFSWMSGYTLKFEQCFQDNGQNLAYFSLCPEKSQCVSGCENGIEYVAGLNYFIDAFTEAQLGAREYACEMAREACEENGEDEENCYANAGLDYCDNDDEGNFNLQEYLECKQFDDYYVGPTCVEGQVYLGYFTEETCTQEVGEGTFYNTYGYNLDYSVESGVSISADECANCREHGAQQDQNEGDQEDEDDVLEQCEELYTYAQSWDQIAAKYDGQVQDVRVSSGRSNAEKGLIAAVVILAVALGAFCCYYGMGKKNEKKTALLSGN